MRIGIVGAGVSGLASLKSAVEEGHQVVCFERTDRLGGCWSGDERTGVDEYGNQIVHGMYKDLTTNLPKEVMVFEGLDHEPYEKSFIGQARVYKYLQAYAAKFNLANYINFCTEVLSINPLSNAPETRWKLIAKDLKTGKQTAHEFDALMVAPGHFNHKEVAKIDGSQLFKGVQLHSNDYRNAANYSGKKVIVIGAGPSGGDIAKRVSHHATRVVQSIKPSSPRFVPVYKDVVEKGEITRFDEHGAHFADGSYEPADAVIFCTGYTYTVPCLTPECGITIENNWFKHLYRHCINIERPSMAIIGLPYGASLFPLVNFQARYYLAYLGRRFQLPSKEAMLQSILEENAARRAKGIPDRAFHSFPDCGRALCDGMAKEARIRPTPAVIFNIMDALHAKWNDTDVFDIVDEETFTRTEV